MSSAEEVPEPPLREIVAEGYSARYAAAVRHVLRIEGGFVDDPVDRGGATKYGISLRFLVAEGAFDEDGDSYADYDLDMDGDIDGRDIRKLTIGDAVYLYHRCFWERIEAERYPAPIGEMMFDQAVNGGLVTACKLLQRAVNTRLMQKGVTSLLVVDGKIGTASRAALSSLLRSAPEIERLAELYREAAKERYRAIARRNPSQNRFLKGWLNRADRMGRA